VKKIRYLGYIMQKNGGAEKHMKERLRRVVIAMKQTWSIGERLFKEDFVRRVKMFNALVGSMALYGAEIWGWKKEEKLDKVARKYMKWILGLDRRTPNYIIKEETKMKEIKIEAIKRAVKYEEETRQSEKKIVVECMKEMEKEGRREEVRKWERWRQQVMQETGISKGEKKEKREREETKEIVKEIVEKIRKKDKEERRKRIEESRYNDSYKNVVTEELPKYLRGRKRKKERIMIARYRCGNEMKGNQHWLKEEDRKCRMCGEEMENIAHVLKECGETRDEISEGEFLKEDGKAGK